MGKEYIYLNISLENIWYILHIFINTWSCIALRNNVAKVIIQSQKYVYLLREVYIFENLE